MTEAQLQDAVVELARLLGWRAVHFRAAPSGRGWRTPVQYDGKGFPDLILVRPGFNPMYRELKVGSRKLDGEQMLWIATLRSCGCDAGVWRDRDWSDGTVERELREAHERPPCTRVIVVGAPEVGGGSEP